MEKYGAGPKTGARSVAQPRAECYKPVSVLLELDRGTGLLELGLEVLGVLLTERLLDGVRRLVHERLRLLQAEACRGADHFDDLDLLLPRRLEHDVELGLLLLGGRGRAVAGCRAGGGSRRYRGRRHAEALL